MNEYEYRYIFGRKRTEGSAHIHVGDTFASLQNREREAKGEKEDEERMSGWFIESLSPARWTCAKEGAGGGAFI